MQYLVGKKISYAILFTSKKNQFSCQPLENNISNFQSPFILVLNMILNKSSSVKKELEDVNDVTNKVQNSLLTHWYASRSQFFSLHFPSLYAISTMAEYFFQFIYIVPDMIPSLCDILYGKEKKKKKKKGNTSPYVGKIGEQ